MNEIVPKKTFSQTQFLQLESEMKEMIERGDLSEIDPIIEHYHAPGVYARVGKFPAGCKAVGKAHRTTHLTMFLKGTGLISNDAGELVEMSAPAIFVVPGGKKKVLHAITECWLTNIHPTDTEDLEEIEKKVIIPDEEFKALCRVQDLRIDQ